MKTAWIVLAVVLLVLVALLVVMRSSTPTGAPVKADTFYPISPTQFALRVFAGAPNEGYVQPLTLTQVRATPASAITAGADVANTTVYVRLIANHEYQLCSVESGARSP